MMRMQLKLGLASALHTLGVLDRLRRARADRGLILTFHRVLPDEAIHTCYEPHVALRASSFEALLTLLAAEYEIVPLEDLLLPAVARARPQLALTFDDGWEDTASVVTPMLQRHGLPATVFLCSALMDAAQPAVLPEERFARIWEAATEQLRLPQLLQDLETWRVAEGLGLHFHAWGRRLKQLPLAVKLMMLEHMEHIYAVALPSARRFLTWDQVRSMQAAGLRFGSHTARHATLNAESPATMLDELLLSRDTIERETGQPCTTVAYPNGAWDERVAQAAAQAGYRYGFTTERGFVGRTNDPLALPRLSVADPLVEDGGGRLHPARTRLYLAQTTARRLPRHPVRQLLTLHPLALADGPARIAREDARAEGRAGAQPMGGTL